MWCCKKNKKDAPVAQTFTRFVNEDFVISIITEDGTEIKKSDEIFIVEVDREDGVHYFKVWHSKDGFTKYFNVKEAKFGVKKTPITYS